MDTSGYRQVFQRMKRSKLEKEEFSPTLKGLINRDWSNVTSLEMNMILVKELKSLLEIDHFEDLIQGIFELSADIQTLKDQKIIDSKVSLEAFYAHLGSLLLRVTQEKICGENDIEWSKALMEGVRVAIEEELYIWQEKNSSFTI